MIRIFSLANGFPQKHVAEAVHITESALEKRLGKMRQQFSVDTTSDLIHLLIKFRLLPESNQNS